MKKRNVLILSIAFLFAASSCNSNNSIDDRDNKSLVTFSLKSEVSHNSNSEGTISNEKFFEYKNLDDYIVELRRNSGEEIFSTAYSQLQLKQEIEQGSYVLKAYKGENVNAGFDKLYMEGNVSFNVSKGEVKKVSCIAVPANARVKVKYSEDFFNYYSDCIVGLKTKYLSEPFNLAKTDANRDLFLKVDDGDNLVITFALKDKNGVPVVPKNFSQQSKVINRRDYLTINIKPKLVNVEGGKIEGISVTIDNGVTEEPINVTIPDEHVLNS